MVTQDYKETKRKLWEITKESQDLIHELTKTKERLAAVSKEKRFE